MKEIGTRWGKTLDAWKYSKSLLEHAGFVEVVEKRYKWPIGGWSHAPRLKHIGRMNQLRLLDNIESFALRLLTGTGGWTIEQTQMYLAEMRMALKDKNVHAYVDVSVVYGRKPNS